MKHFKTELQKKANQYMETFVNKIKSAARKSESIER